MSCNLYVIGHEHVTFGHAVKVGIASNVSARLAAFQTGNVEALKIYFSFRFESRDIAAEVERIFHRSELAGPIRGEWVGCDPEEVLFYLTIVIAKVLCRFYGRDSISNARRDCGLHDAFAITDLIPSERQTYLTDRIEIVGDLVL